MHADFSVELARDDAALELPWNSADPAVRYYDLKRHPELLREIAEAVAWPELGAFLARINAAGFPLATAKCDAWTSREVAPEEEIFGDCKFVSYIDLVFVDETQRCSFEKHEAFAKGLCRLLSQTPEIPAAVEVVIRRCYYHGKSGVEAAIDEGGAGGRAEEVEIEFEVQGGTGAREAVEVEDLAEAESGRAVAGEAAGEVKDDDEQQSGGANREDADRSAATERTARQIDIGHRREREGRADAGERFEADIEEAEPAKRLDETAADERIMLGGQDSVGGFSFTAYVTGFGDNDHEPRLRWQIALALLQNALVQLARDQGEKH